MKITNRTLTNEKQNNTYFTNTKRKGGTDFKAALQEALMNMSRNHRLYK